MSKASNYFNSVKAELSKVIFPTNVQIRTAYISVFIVVTVIALFLALIDGAMSLGLSMIIN
ncbi:preprotein translocase subunit SecE [Aliarcobacter skirrowii]|uniref:preprotein translocase subunit SecE n=1 Tax=Aliarcobacter skirrowii TaxID=28200 RepID=UPI0029AD23D0|nr:preprotein translocase subunit SecE [Aliarcobacter skirrowii]MDX4011391.1 preprotein translocase subunit SecE [Aliarcobacter skirrowii]